MLRTSRKLDSNLGGWVVSAGLIRRLWPDQVSFGNDEFHEQDPRWCEEAAQLHALIIEGPHATDARPVDPKDGGRRCIADHWQR